MTHNAQAIRDAAMLINSLDPASADLLLEQMGEEQAAQVRAAVMDLDDVSDDQLAGLMTKFFSGDDQTTVNEEDEGVFLDLSRDDSVAEVEPQEPALDATSLVPDVDDNVLAETSETTDQSREPAGEDSAIFHQLTELADAELAPLLAHERPQTIAAVLARLSPKLAARVLSRLPVGQQTEIVDRIAHMQPANDAALAEVEASLSQSLLRHGATWGEPSQGLQAMQAILASADEGHRAQLLGTLQHQDHRLVGQLDLQGNHSPPPTQGRLPGDHLFSSTDGATHPTPIAFTFEQLVDLDGESLSKVLLAAEWKIVLLALAGADRKMMKTIGSHLPPSQQAALQRQIEQQGPIRLRDIERAQEAIASVAKDLMSVGDIPRMELGFVSAA